MAALLIFNKDANPNIKAWLFFEQQEPDFDQQGGINGHNAYQPVANIFATLRGRNANDLRQAKTPQG